MTFQRWGPMDDFRIRTMRADEVGIAIDWAAAEGWNPGLADAACFYAADPGGFLLGELDGVPAATISCVNYGDSYSFLGLYIVRSDVRGRGFGMRLWNAAIARGRSRDRAGRRGGAASVLQKNADFRLRIATFGMAALRLLSRRHWAHQVRAHWI